MSFRIVGVWLWVALGVSFPVAAGADSKVTRDPLVEAFEVQQLDQKVLVSYTVRNAFSEEILERIHSGIPVSFRHRLEVVADRTFPFPSRLLARTIVESQVSYDSLTRRYELVRVTTRRGRDKKPVGSPVEERRVTDSGSQMRAWMTELREVEVADPSRPSHPWSGDRLQVRVESTLGRRYVMLIFPGKVSASAERRLQP